MSSDLLSVLQAPISASSPAGADVTYDDDFLRLKAAVDSIGTVRADGVDFGLIVDLGKKVLVEKSKDVRVAVFLTFGLERTLGMAGMADGLAALDTVVRTYWDSLYPPLSRMVGRQNALQSLSDRLKESLGTLKPTLNDQPHLERALGHAKVLQEFTLAQMAEKAPALSGLVQALEEALRRVPKATHSVQPQPDGAPSPSRAAAMEPTPDVPVQDAALHTTSDARSAVLRVVDFLREQDAASPTPYRLARVAHWSALREAPPDENGRTRIPAPSSQRREFLQRLLDERKADQLVKEAEDTFHEFPFLLDAQRLLVQGMETKPGFDEAAEAVTLELAILLRRLAQLPDLQFDDGTPFADTSTRAWIETSVHPLLGGGSTDRPVAAAGPSALDEQYQKAREHLVKGDLAGALSILQEGRSTDASGADRFMRQLYTARLATSSGKHALARSIFEALSDEVERRDLADWAPHLALDVWTDLYRSLHELARSADGAEANGVRQHAEKVFEKICSLDAGRALTLVGKS